MRNHRPLEAWFALMATMAGSGLAAEQNEAALRVLPRPVTMEQHAGSFAMTPGLRIVCPPEAGDVARYLADALKTTAGLSPVVMTAPGEPPAIILRLETAGAQMGDEGYRMAVTTGGVELAASTTTGLLWGVQSFRQLLRQGQGAWRVPCLTVEDRPRFGWRGLMLDCSRTFQSLDYLKKTVERMAVYKLNVLHLHLTDDQGWRLEIRKHPELTAKGARFPEQFQEPAEHQGFYTQAEMRDLIAFASARGITIVPEIEMPGHSLAALAVLPHLSCRGTPVEIFPFFKGDGVTRDVLCAGNEETFKFLDDVLTEVCALFPSRFVHVGGDEVPKDRWKACPKCQVRMKAEGLKNEHELQSWFIRRAEVLLARQGKRLIGWDEILEGGLAPNAAVMSWRGTEGGTVAARAGHDVVMSPTSHCYFDYSYKQIDTARAYAFEPVPSGLGAGQAAHLLGLQANFWSHIDREPAKVDRQLFPRLLAIAERGWSPRETTDWTDFARRVEGQLATLNSLGIAYDRGPLDHAPRADGRWTPALVSETYAPLTWTITSRIAGAGSYRARLQYTSGACRLGIEKVELLADGEVVAADTHRGVTGATDQDNVYRLKLDTHRPGAKYELRASARSEGGRDSSGIVSVDKE